MRNRQHSAVLLLVLLSAASLNLLTACQPETPVKPAAVESSADPVSEPDAAAQLLALTDVYMEQLLTQSPYLQVMAGKRVSGMPDNSHAGVSRLARNASALLGQLAEIDPETLEHNDYLTYVMFRDLLERTVESEQHFWHQFNITPYAVGRNASLVLPIVLGGTRLDSATDVDYYLDFLQDIARYFKDDLIRLSGQEERDILLPTPAIAGARNAISGVGDMIRKLTVLSAERQAALEESERTRLNGGITATLEGQIQPAIDNLLNYLDADYVERAPDTVGLHQYRGGEDAYRFAIRQQTTMNLDPQDIHDRGLAYLSTLNQRMADVRTNLGFEGTKEEFHALLRSDPQFYAESADEVADRYMAHIQRIEPHIADYFTVMPKAPYGVKRLDPAQEPGMTFGIYQPPSLSEPTGYYRFNGSKLSSRPMVWAASLIYHELIPGHHFHIALATEHQDLSHFRRTTSLMYAAFTEGWANYAASLATEMGVMDDPWDQYGWLLFDAFITARLVVDTGLNHLGWTLDQATDYMLTNTFSSPEEVASEVLRYATDMPAQALAYKLGFEKIREIRTEQEDKLGDDFDIRAFHAAIMDSGGLPLPLLEMHVDRALSPSRSITR